VTVLNGFRSGTGMKHVLASCLEFLRLESNLKNEEEEKEDSDGTLLSK